MASLTSSQIVSGNPIHPSKILGPVEPTVKRELNISPQNVRFKQTNKQTLEFSRGFATQFV